MPKTTPGTTQRTAVAADWALDPADADACERLARTLCTGGHDQVDNPEWVAGARDAWEELPFLLRRGIRRFRRHSGPHGTLVIGGLPVDQAALPATPSVLGSVQRQVSVSAAVLTMVACGLGEPLAYRAEKSGALVQDVVPVPGQETFHGNAGSVPLSFHTENGFHPHPPDYVIFLCLRADHDGIMRHARQPASAKRCPSSPQPAARPCSHRSSSPRHHPPSAPTLPRVSPTSSPDRCCRERPRIPTYGWLNSSPPRSPPGHRGTDRIRPRLRGDRPHPAPDTRRPGHHRQPRHRPRPHRLPPPLRRSRPLAATHLRHHRPTPLPRPPPPRRPHTHPLTGIKSIERCSRTW